MSRAARASAQPHHVDPDQSPSGRHLKRQRSLRWLKWTAAALSILVVGGIAFSGIQLFRLQNNVATAPLDARPGAEPKLPVDQSKAPLQILVMGTDTRTGQKSLTDQDNSSGEGNSDVMMLLNLSADRQRVSVVSFPRDLMTPLPACEDPSTKEVVGPLATGQLNSTLAAGGPGCTVAAINEITGLDIDHFMLADFDAVKDLSQTLGGVQVCLNSPVDDQDSGLKLPAGISTIQGDQALAFLRNRKGFNNGSDIGRIRSQQSFLASMVRKVKEEGTLDNLPKMYSIAESITKNLTVDPGLKDVGTLLSVGDRLRNTDLNNVVFITAPVVEDPADPNRVILDQPKAEQLFKTLRADGDVLSAGGKTGSPSGAATASADPSAGASDATGSSTTGSSTPESSPSALPKDFPVHVANRSEAPSNRAQQVLQLLKGLGYASTDIADTDAVQQGLTLPTTQILVPSGMEDAGKQLAASLGISDAQVLTTASVDGVTLVIGQDFTSGDKLAGGGDLGDGLSGQTAQNVTCQSANPN